MTHQYSDHFMYDILFRSPRKYNGVNWNKIGYIQLLQTQTKIDARNSILNKNSVPHMMWQMGSSPISDSTLITHYTNWPMNELECYIESNIKFFDIRVYSDLILDQFAYELTSKVYAWVSQTQLDDLCQLYILEKMSQ